MPALPEDLFQDVVDLLVPFMNQEARDSLLTIVLSTEPVYHRIDWKGAAKEFTVRLVFKLSHDELTNVLKKLKAAEGAQYAPRIESLCERIYQEQQKILRRQVSDRDAVPSTSPNRPSFFQLPDPKTSPASRSPIVIALEEQDAPLREDELLRTERHITIAFSASQLQLLDDIGASLSTSSTVAHIRDRGRQAWQVLKAAQPALQTLVEKVAGAGGAQPVAWTGRTALLIRVYRALLLAYTGASDGVESFLSISCGGQYFSPLAETRSLWKVQPPSPNPLSVSTLLHGTENEAAAMVEAAASDVTVLLTDDVTTVLRSFVDVVSKQESGGTRVAIVLGRAELSPELLDHALNRIPCVSVGSPGLNNDDVVGALKQGFEALGAQQAAPCIMSTIRRAWIERAWNANEANSFLDGLLWSIWSWVGRPLFAKNFGEVEPAAYPHLMDLRSVAAKGWYFNRREGIPDKYQADTLARSGGPPEQKFHLYLSGAGGTGKSCFLHYVYDQLLHHSDVLPVWYRVDSPGSKWEDIEQRIRQETVAVARQKMGDASSELIPAGDGKLSNFLVEIAKKMRATDAKVKEVVVFIDQLERTFESGDEPDQVRLQNISSEIIDLLKTVKVGEGIRIFIASRKQYLPDFLRSFQAAEDCRLHFNVLQTIDAVTDRAGFVDQVLEWCKQQNLVHERLSFDRGTREKLAESAKGHPLNMMLALIQLFSRHREGRITEKVLDEARPWERLFDLDVEAMAKDEMDWNFLLAMAHARAEIVRFEEVWWRLRLVDPKLTRRVDDLRPQGVRERLWLLGHFGRTIYPRPYVDDPARFLEFFHANLRDYLLREVMGQGGAGLVLFGRKCETPEAWRALDRLSTFAHEWEQVQQPLAYDDVRVLMLHKHVVVEKPKPKDEPEERQPFHLLFERDAEKSRPRLCLSAKECFVFSALLYDEAGEWAFEALFPEIFSDDETTPENEKQDRISCCKRWLRRCSPEQRTPVLRYVVELLRLEPSVARDFITSMVLPQPQPLAEGLWLDLAQILAEPFYAARYRDEVVAAAVEKAVSKAARSETTVAALPSRIGEFIAAACGANRDELVSVLSHCAMRFKGSQDERLRRFAGQLESTNQVVDDWLSRVSPSAGVELAIDLRERHGRTPPPVELKLGSELVGAVTPERVATWHKELRERLGVPLPEFELAAGEGEANELELRLRDKRIATGSFYESRIQILQRHCKHPPPEAHGTQNDALQEVVFWVDKEFLSQTRWELPASEFDKAVVDWLEEMLRRSIDDVFDFDLLIEFINEIATAVDSSRLFHGVSLQILRQVVVNLVHERVPLAKHRTDIVDKLQQLAIQVKDSEVLTQKLREHVKDDLCRAFSDDSAQLSVLLLGEAFEEQLLDQVRRSDDGSVLGLEPSRASALASVIIRQLELNLMDEDARPVVFCPSLLRMPLFRMLRPFDPRIYVLSATEMSRELSYRLAGLVEEPRPSAV